MNRKQLQEQLMKMPVLDDGTVETYEELKNDRDRLHNIYIQQTFEINKLKGELSNQVRERVKLEELDFETKVKKILNTLSTK